MKTLVSNLRVPVSALADSVYQYGQYLKANFSRADLTEDGDDETAGGDMRLQVLAGPDYPLVSWRTWEGDNQFDTDHRGFWGSAFVPYGCTRKESQTIARQLVEEAQEAVAMSE